MSKTTTSGFGALEAAAKISADADKAKAMIAASRTRMVLGRDARSAFFSMLAMRLRVQRDDTTGTAATDGKRLIYNPSFIAGLTPQELDGVIAHEVMHCAMAHHARRGDRNPRAWNIACDLAINPIIVGAGMKLPAGCLMPGQGQFASMPSGLSAEAYYGLLPKGARDGGGGDDPGACGGVMDAGDPAQQRAAEAEWKVATEAAREAAKQRGDMPGSLTRAIEEANHPTADWRDILRRFVSRSAKNDYTWSPPNRRFVGMGIYLPSQISEELGLVILAVDTSGSIGPQTLAEFASEASAILAAYDCRLRILYHDAAVAGVQEWSSTDGPLVLRPVGGGGTDHRPVFARADEDGDQPTCMICLTDAETRFPDAAPDYPVLWALTQRRAVPFGESCLIGGAA